MAPSTHVALRSSDPAVSSVDPNQTLKASKALLAYMKKASKENAAAVEKKNLLAEDSDDEDSASAELPIWLTFTTKRYITDTNRLKPGKISLPHPLHRDDPNLRICIITVDPQRAYKNLVASDEFNPELRKKISRIIDFGKLKAKFKVYENLRKLYAEHDVFLGDSRIINMLPKVLGKTFYKSTAKRPIPVDIAARKPKVDGKRVKPSKGADDKMKHCSPTELAAEVQKAVGAALVTLSASTNTAVKIGYASYTPDQIAENANVVCNTLVDKYVPQKWRNVKSIYLKGPETAALPIFLTNELWLDEKDIVADASEEAKALMPAEKANIGKKRKSLEGPTEETAPLAKKVKKEKTKAKKMKAEENNDDKLGKEIAERKARLKKQKAAAKKAVGV